MCRSAHVLVTAESLQSLLSLLAASFLDFLFLIANYSIYSPYLSTISFNYLIKLMLFV